MIDSIKPHNAPPAYVQTISAIGSNTIAQTPPIQTVPEPNLDQQPQQIPAPELRPTPPPEIEPIPTPNPVPNPPAAEISIQKIEVVGSTILKPIEIQQITQPFEGKLVTSTQLQGVANAITQLYVKQGYINSKAIVSKQAIINGIVEIQIIEGSIDRIEIHGLEQLRSAYVRDRLQLGIRKPFNKNPLEDQLKLLKRDPLLADIRIKLKFGTSAGRDILVVRLKESNRLTGFISTDNYSSLSTGSEKFSSTLSYKNVSGLGDVVSASYIKSFQGGANTLDFNYRLPVNEMNGTVQLRYTPSRSKIIDPKYAALGIRSDSNSYEVSYRQPLIRNPREEFALSLGLEFQDGQTFLYNDRPYRFESGPDAKGNTRTRVLKFGQDYVSRDAQGVWTLHSQLDFGLNIFNATNNASPIPSGKFFSWAGQVQRAQRLDKNQLLIAQANIQLSPDNLLSAQQFVIGGRNSIRGYRPITRSGDNGFRVSVEDRIALQKDRSGTPTLQLVPFAEMGTVWSRGDNPNNRSSPSQNFLSSVGLGAIYQPSPQLTMRVDYAVPFLNLDRSNQTSKNQSVYVSVSYGF